MSATTPHSDADSHPIRVLLVDDQPLVGETVRQMLADEPGVAFRFCPDPVAAIDVANEFRPTVILQDLVMPDVDGLLLVKFYRANPATRITPLVVLSSKEEPVIKARAFALGGNDYLVKLPDRLEVVARIRHHSEGYISRLERDALLKQLEGELRQAARYVQSLLPAKWPTGPVTIDWRFVPSTQLGGDMFGYHWIDPDHLAVYLLDVSGHGVGSSLLAVSAANLLTAQSLPGADCRNPGDVLAKLNDIFQMDRQDGKYFTIWYGVYRPADRTLAWSNAGHPPALLATDGVLVPMEADGPATGMVPGMPYDTKTQPVAPGGRLLVYSDGIYEIEKPGGEMWQYHEFAGHIGPRLLQDGALMDEHLAFVRGMRAGQPLGDDFSMMEVRFGDPPTPTRDAGSAKPPRPAPRTPRRG
jgi:sigma-B regulation protein RsbU (phosphoserine phosphatase)